MDEKELAAELQASKHDPAEWGDAESGPTEQRGRRLSAMVSIRLAKDELELVQRRAQERGQSVSAYMREAALRDVGGESRGDVHVPFAVSISTAGTYTAHVNAPTLVDGQRLATTSW